MSNLVIVAIPREDDPVWRYSSEPVPHCTLLFLGSSDQEMRIAAFLQHAVTIWDRGPFSLSVDYRDTLGDDEADVLFFRKDWSTKELASFRAILLKDKNIRDAFDSNDQFPEWNPHLTMGYPSKPAKKDNRDYPGFHWVEFDRIALWTGDFEGPEFRLEYNYQNDWPMGEVMSMTAAEKGKEFIEHFGVKGQKWGVRRDRMRTAVGSSQSSTVVRGRAKVKTTGGEGHEAHSDAVKIAEKTRILKKSGIKALSNEDLRDVANRLQLEQQVKGLTTSKGQKAVKDILGQQTRQEVNRQVTSLALKKRPAVPKPRRPS